MNDEGGSGEKNYCSVFVRSSIRMSYPSCMSYSLLPIMSLALLSEKFDGKSDTHQ